MPECRDAKLAGNFKLTGREQHRAAKAVLAKRQLGNCIDRGLNPQAVVAIGRRSTVTRTGTSGISSIGAGVTAVGEIGDAISKFVAGRRQAGRRRQRRTASVSA